MSGKVITKIYTPLFISTLILPVAVIFGAVWFLISNPSTVYSLPLLLLLCFLLYKVWIIFEPIKIIKIDIARELFILIPRNLLKKLFINEDKIPFSEVKSFIVTEGSEYFHENRRYIVSALLKDASIITFTQTQDHPTAIKITESLNKILLINK